MEDSYLIGETLVRLGLALALWTTGFLIFGRFIAPRWKVAGKLAFYVAVSAILSLTVGNWSLLWIIGHPLLGVVGHWWWCRKNEINWLSCTPRDRYLALRPWATSDGFEPRNPVPPA